MHHNLFLVTLILFDKCRKITVICRIKCEKVRKTTEFSSPHNPEVVGSSSASATITDTVMDTNVSVTVSFFISVFTPKQGDFPNFATHLL